MTDRSAQLTAMLLCALSGAMVGFAAATLLWWL